VGCLLEFSAHVSGIAPAYRAAAFDDVYKTPPPPLPPLSYRFFSTYLKIYT
jgi:hypothetical protein